jgi:hypothetical protein
MIKESEWRTRKYRIDKRLSELPLPWHIKPYGPDLDLSRLDGTAVTEYPTQNGPADYVFVVKGKILGVLEAKKVGTGAQNVLEQAKRYSQGLEDGAGNWRGFRAPFLYSSNGEEIWFADVREEKYYERELADFHTPDAVGEMFGRDRAAAKKWLAATPVEIEGLRPYQQEAVESHDHDTRVVGLTDEKPEGIGPGGHSQRRSSRSNCRVRLISAATAVMSADISAEPTNGVGFSRTVRAYSRYHSCLCRAHPSMSGLTSTFIIENIPTPKRKCPWIADWYYAASPAGLPLLCCNTSPALPLRPPVTTRGLHITLRHPPVTTCDLHSSVSHLTVSERRFFVGLRQVFVKERQLKIRRTPIPRRRTTRQRQRTTPSC